MDDEIQIFNFIQSHQAEINSLKKQCKTKQCKSYLQRIPRHMRRRAASNNPKRLPKSLQEFVPKNEQFNKKQGRNRRLISRRNFRTRNKDPRRTLLHIWFAKRFKFEFRWKQFIPHRNNTKNQRVLYRNYSRNGYSVFYMPMVKSFILECPKNSTLCFSKFCSPEDSEQLWSNGSKIVHFYEYEQYPYNLIGPCLLMSVINSFGLTKFYLSGHKIVFESLKEQFQKHILSERVTLKELPLSHIRLCGPESLKRLKTKLSHKIEINDDERFKCSNLDHEECLEFGDFIEKLDDNSNRIALSRYHIDQIEIIDLIILDQNLKITWNRLNENMTHLVGGLRDLQVMALNTGSVLFPDIGYVDSVVNQSESENKQNLPKTPSIKRYPMFNQNQEEKYFIIRSGVHFTIDDLLANNWPEDLKNQALVQIGVDYLKGTPRQFDLIMAPDKNGDYFNNFAYNNIGDEGQDPLLLKQDVTGQLVPIGFVEYGCFSMKHARCRAFGLIAYSDLGRLVEFSSNIQRSNEAINSATGFKDSLYAYVKTHHNHLYLVKIFLINTNSIL